MSVSFALAAPVFLALYDTWLRDVVLGGDAEGDEHGENRQPLQSQPHVTPAY